LIQNYQLKIILTDIVCVDSNLISPTMRRGHVGSSQSPAKASFTSSRTTTLPNRRKERSVVGTATEGQLTQTSLTDRNKNTCTL